jgi:chemotaxis protein MotB
VENVEDVEVREAMKSVQGTWKLWLLVLAVTGLGGYGVFHLREELEAARHDVAEADARATKKHAELVSMKQVRTELESRIDELQRENATLAPLKQQMELEARMKEEARTKLQTLSDTLAAAIKGDPAASDVDFAIDGDKLRVTLADKSLFDAVEPVLSKKGDDVLLKLGPTLAALTDQRMQISGHTDGSPIPEKLKATIPSAWELSSLYASAVARNLVEKSKVKDGMLEVVGRAATRPSEKGTSPKAKAKNRRVEILIDAPPAAPAEDPQKHAHGK